MCIRDSEDFARYVDEHGRRITYALALIGPFEIIFAAWLWLDTPAGLSRTVVFLSGALLAAGWISTALWFGPLHGRFQGPYDEELINQLIITNWFRTALWALRALLASWFLWQALTP